MFRILNPGGIFLFTTRGDSVSKNELLKNELREYKEKGILVRGQYEEGKKMFLTTHSTRYVREILLAEFDILKHVPDEFPYTSFQDYWVARKKS